jgi:hypothetical protein
MTLSEHFSLEEFVYSETAIRRGIDNTPPSMLIPTLVKTAYGMEEVRSLLGHPIHINSAFRSNGLNAFLGSKATSQHTTGEAVDFVCREFGTPDQIVKAIQASDIGYDQLIREFDSWVHISFSDRNRRQALIIDDVGPRAYA